MFYLFNCSVVSEACGVLQCDLDCPYGFVHGADSCPICQCLDPCQVTTLVTVSVMVVVFKGLSKVPVI